MTQISIEVRRPNQDPEILNFQDGKYSIGREVGDIVLHDAPVSGKHGELTVQNGEVVYTDVGSTNGSFVDGGARITTPYSLPVGGVIRLGDCKLKLLRIDAVSPSAKTVALPPMAKPVSKPPAAKIQSAPPAAVSRPPAQSQGGKQPGEGPKMAKPVSKPPAAKIQSAPPAAISKPPAQSQRSKQSPAPSQSQAGEQSAEGPKVAKPVSKPPAEIQSAPPAAISQPPAQEQADEQSGEGRISDEAANDGLINDFVALMKYAFATLKPHIVEVALPIAVVGTIFPLLVAILTQIMLIAPIIGAVLALIVSILGIIATFPIIIVMTLIIYPVVARYALALYLEEPVTMGEAWSLHKRNLGANLVCTFINLVVGGVTLGLLGVYMFQVPYVEGLRNVDVNMRSWEIFKQSWKRVLVFSIGSWILFFVPTAIAARILGFIPFLGPIAGAILWGLMPAVYIPVIMLILARIYFETRAENEVEDPRPAARTAINEN